MPSPPRARVRRRARSIKRDAEYCESLSIPIKIGDSHDAFVSVRQLWQLRCLMHPRMSLMQSYVQPTTHLRQPGEMNILSGLNAAHGIVTLDVFISHGGAKGVVARGIGHMNLMGATSLHPRTHWVKHIAKKGALGAIDPLDPHPLC